VTALDAARSILGSMDTNLKDALLAALLEARPGAETQC